jgi:hypothetical protein
MFNIHIRELHEGCVLNHEHILVFLARSERKILKKKSLLASLRLSGRMNVRIQELDRRRNDFHI